MWGKHFFQPRAGSPQLCASHYASTEPRWVRERKGTWYTGTCKYHQWHPPIHLTPAQFLPWNSPVLPLHAYNPSLPLTCSIKGSRMATFQRWSGSMLYTVEHIFWCHSHTVLLEWVCGQHSLIMSFSWSLSGIEGICLFCWPEPRKKTAKLYCWAAFNGASCKLIDLAKLYILLL